MVEASSALQHLNPGCLQASHSPNSASLSDGTNLSQAARIDMLEARQCKMEQKQHKMKKTLWDFRERLMQLGN